MWSGLAQLMKSSAISSRRGCLQIWHFRWGFSRGEGAGWGRKRATVRRREGGFDFDLGLVARRGVPRTGRAGGAAVRWVVGFGEGVKKRNIGEGGMEFASSGA